MERKLKKNDGEEEKEGQVNEDTDVESIYIKWRCGRTERMGVSGHLDAGMFLGVGGQRCEVKGSREDLKHEIMREKWKGTSSFFLSRRDEQKD